jgi:hypothetical protein
MEGTMFTHEWRGGSLESCRFLISEAVVLRTIAPMPLAVSTAAKLNCLFIGFCKVRRN